MNGAYISPDGKHSFDFINEGEIPFGPPFFTIVFNGVRIANKLFGFTHRWSPDSHYLALQEWLSTDYRKGLYTALSIIATEDNQIARISHTKGGFIVPLRFDNGMVIFQKEFLGKGVFSEFEVIISNIVQWQDL